MKSRIKLETKMAEKRRPRKVFFEWFLMSWIWWILVAIVIFFTIRGN